MDCLSKEEIGLQMQLVDPSWKLNETSIERDLVFADFKEAFAFMVSVSVIAEQLNHHPNWSNIYNKVWITLSTHDVGGLTALDFSFAKAVDQVLLKL